MTNTYSVKLLYQALNDIAETKEWYNAQKSNLGNEFVKEVKSGIEKIRNYPEAFPVVYRKVRKLFIKKFPFKIFYMIDERYFEITIIGVIHGKRNPKLFRERL